MTIPNYRTPEARTAEVVRCGQGHVARREVFDASDGCPWCMVIAGWLVGERPTVENKRPRAVTAAEGMDKRS